MTIWENKKAPERSGAFVFYLSPWPGPDPAIQSKLAELCL
jgi:hypothetical protein